jgi:hypothetical protein
VLSIPGITERGSVRGAEAHGGRLWRAGCAEGTVGREHSLSEILWRLRAKRRRLL